MMYALSHALLWIALRARVWSFCGLGALSARHDVVATASTKKIRQIERAIIAPIWSA